MDLKKQVTYKNTLVTVTAGFDPVLRRFWAIIEPVEEDNPHADEESGLIYSNLDDPNVSEEDVKFSPDYFDKKFREMGVLDLGDFFARVYASND